MPRLTVVAPQQSHFSTEESTSPSHGSRSTWAPAIENFNPMWFSICISSGGLGLVLNAPFPYPARWLSICGDILFGIELLLFVGFLGIMAARWILYPRSALQRLLSDQQELCAYAIIPITLLTIAALVASQISTAWGGYPFTIVAYVLWWIAMTMIMLYCVAVISILSYSSQHVGSVMMPALFLPIVGVATAAVEAASVSAKAYDLSITLAVPVIIMGYFLLGLSTWMAIILYTVFFHRLMTLGWPPSSGVAGLAILVGPSGQIASGFQLLGENAGESGLFAQYEGGTFFTEQTGAIFESAGTLLAMLFMGLAFMWFLVAAYAIVDMGLLKRRQKYTLTWWAVVFPIVTLDTAIIQLAKSMDSPALRVLATALFVFLFTAYLINWILTIWSVFQGDILFAPAQPLPKGDEADHAQHDTDYSDGPLLV
ncbi:hypothetical protein N0V93_002737 [Gnomoniopsis smithogilvyi]|uniref:C4-dicarboxylate transporter/malic acid transport protein n=1 Tax=Gnomoniopsis smithogilvyi TaxID=1191159 RepID=A0A9W8YVC1_9PEZI|nr:hypothetical protein N0V93_002737 [Gnomoniopsis smithogilvyi]